MRLNKKTLAFIAAWTICAQGRAYPQSAMDQLQRLVETSAQRIVIAEQVALAKWDSGAAVDDASREAQVIASAIKEGEYLGGLQSMWLHELSPVILGQNWVQLEEEKWLRNSW